MRICFVVNECGFFYSHRFGLAKMLAELGEVFLITDIENTDKEIIKKISKNNIKLHPIKRRTTTKGFLGFILYFYRLFVAIKKVNPTNVFFITLEISFFGAINSFLSKKTNSFFLITGFGQFLFNQNIKYKLFYKLNKLVFSIATMKKNTKFIFQNKKDKDIFLKRGFSSEEKSIVINGSGIDASKFQFYQRKASRSVSFLFSSRLVKAKGIREYLDAGKKIKNIFPETKINIAGKYDPSDSDSISKELFLEIQNSSDCNYLGEIRHDDMENCYKQSDIFVLPSYGEGLPKAALEAAASGMPLILSNASGCLECINNNETNGLIISSRCTESLKTAMESIINSEEKISKMSIASRQMIEEKFSLKKIYLSYKNLIL